MVTSNLLPLLKQKGLTLMWLNEQTGIGYQRLLVHCHDQAKMVKYATLDKICEALNCEISDLLTYTKTTEPRGIPNVVASNISSK